MSPHPIPFDERVSPPDANGCRLWTGALHNQGYGQVRYQGKVRKAHRVAWERAYGQIPDGMHVLHRCDNPPCVELSHLFLGTNTDNIADKVTKGRAQRLIGEAHPLTRLTASQVAAIRISDKTHRVLAAEYGVSRSCISMIRCGKNWRFTSDERPA